MSAVIPKTEHAIHWLQIGKLAEIPRQGARRINTDGKTIAVFRTADDEVFAIDDQCPHAGGPLSQGIVHGDCVTCPLHNWVISLRDGMAQGADTGNTRSYEIRMDGQQIMIGLEQQDT